MMMMIAKMKVVAAWIAAALVIAGATVPIIGVEPAGQKPPAERLLKGPPLLRKVDGGYEVSFEASRPTDVTVRIVDAEGQVVRHLASGMVGLAKAAKPLQAASLSQKIVWDGKDDAGGDAPTGCKVTVAAGISAKFDKFIIWEKDACPRSRGSHYYAAGNGEYYVNQSSGVHLDTMRVFDAEGKLTRQAWPPSLNRSKQAVQGLLAGRWGATDWDGDSVPMKVCYNSWYLFGVRSGGITCTSDGYLVGLFKGVGQGLYSIDQTDFPVAMHWKPPWFVRDQTYKTKWSLGDGTDGDFYLTDNYHHIVGHFREGHENV